jgi:hypothetical protein
MSHTASVCTFKPLLLRCRCFDAKATGHKARGCRGKKKSHKRASRCCGDSGGVAGRPLSLCLVCVCVLLTQRYIVLHKRSLASDGDEGVQPTIEQTPPRPRGFLGARRRRTGRGKRRRRCHTAHPRGQTGGQQAQHGAARCVCVRVSARTAARRPGCLSGEFLCQSVTPQSRPSRTAGWLDERTAQARSASTRTHTRGTGHVGRVGDREHRVSPSLALPVGASSLCMAPLCPVRCGHGCLGQRFLTGGSRSVCPVRAVHRGQEDNKRRRQTE